MTKPNRYTIYAGEPLQRALAGFEGNRSGRINQICDRYMEIIEAECPPLTEPEWLALCDLLNGTWLDDQASVRFLWAEVADSKGTAEKWGIDTDDLAKRVRSMSQAQTTAIVEVVQKFWAVQNPEIGNAETLLAVGANVKNG